jgi:arabinofuranan 3-O-arabinosyltransferase
MLRVKAGELTSRGFGAVSIAMSSPGWRQFLEQTRRLSAAAGIVALLSLAFLPEGTLADRLALSALFVLGFGAALGWLQLASAGHVDQTVPRQTDRPNLRLWLLLTLGVALLAGLAIQSWFKPGTAIAAGDTVLPNGTAWLARLFDPWTWTGFSLGEASQQTLSLPWAATVGVVHAVGGDADLAQRVWYTALFVLAALSAVGLIASLRLGPMAAVVGAAAYLLNPYVLSQVNTNPVFLAALCPLAAMPAVLIAAGTGRLRTGWAVALFVAPVPVVGYVFANPPLVGMILGAALATPLLVACVDGKAAALRSLRALAVGFPVFLVVSAYWIVPAAIHLGGFSGSQLSDVSSWAWTEIRASIRNAFWLNNTWGWSHPEYYPYAARYDSFPLSAFRFILPIFAFGALGLRAAFNRTDGLRVDRELRLTVVLSTVALFLVLLSTGTNPPGKFVFNPLYNLPFGWLLREPGRFLMLAALAYAGLIAVIVEAALSHRAIVKTPTPRTRLVFGLQDSVVPVSLGILLALGFPLYTGAVVPDVRPQLPPAHAQLPTYWTQMASVVDASPKEGSLLVLPPDDFYGMPYSWGYYGADDFVARLFRRPVVVPNPQGNGYVPGSPGLIGAVNLAAQSILRHDWPQAEVLVTALNTPLVLVRRDIQSPYGSRQIVPPADLEAALKLAPNFELVRQIGLLDLYELKSATADPAVAPHFATIDTTVPDLRLLSVLPPGSALVSSKSEPGVPYVVQAPALESWSLEGDTLVWRTAAAPDYVYRLADLALQTTAPIDTSSIVTIGRSKVRAEFTSDGKLAASVLGRNGISNGDFAAGPWGQVSDCRAFTPALARLDAKVLEHGAPRGLPALQLSATYDSACVSQSIDWRGGSLIVSLMVNRVQGGAPRLCLWEIGPERCAPLPAIPASTGWSPYRASVELDPGTTSTALYLYADASPPGTRTVTQYADAHVVEVPALASLALVADPPQAATSSELVVLHNTFSSEWKGPNGGRHVLVDGMVNGWLMPIGGRAFSAYYAPADTFIRAQWLSLVSVILLVLVLAGSSIGRRWIRGRKSKGPSP